MFLRLMVLMRYGIVLMSCSLLALFPWVMTAISDPLPVELQKTGTVLAITRTAREFPQLAEKMVLALGLTATPTSSPTSTFTPTSTMTQTPTITVSPTSTLTMTPTWTNTPFPDVRGVAGVVVNTYSCPDPNRKKGSLQMGAVFHIFGWDQTTVDGETITWLLIEDLVDYPQRWIQDSKYVTLSDPEYRAYVPRAACRTAAR